MSHTMNGHERSVCCSLIFFLRYPIMGINAVLGSYLENSPQVSCWDEGSPSSGCPQTLQPMGNGGNSQCKEFWRASPVPCPDDGSRLSAGTEQGEGWLWVKSPQKILKVQLFLNPNKYFLLCLGWEDVSG